MDGPDDLQGVERLSCEDSDVGAFRVSTVTGLYLLDLSKRRLLRAPAEVRSRGWALEWSLDIDGSWMSLLILLRCKVGEPMRATVVHQLASGAQPLRSSPVQSIQLAETD